MGDQHKSFSALEDDALTQEGGLRADDADLRPEPRRTMLGTAWRFVLRAVAVFVLACAVWVVAYALINPPTTLLMLQEQARLGAIEQEWRPLDDIPPHLRRAVVAAEDARFCDHFGIDPDAISDAVADFQAGRRLRGASTITQQTAKNVFLWPERAWMRKGLEAWFAGLIELAWTKERILEVYLNVAEFGPGVFGVSAAARRSFGGTLAGLSEGQAARLAAVLPNPRGRDANAPTPELLARAGQINTGANDIALTGAARCFGG